MEGAPDKSLPFTQDVADDDDLPPEEEQELLAQGEDDPSILATASVEQDLPIMSGDSLDMPLAKKCKPDDGAPSM